MTPEQLKQYAEILYFVSLAICVITAIVATREVGSLNTSDLLMYLVICLAPLLNTVTAIFTGYMLVLSLMEQPARVLWRRKSGTPHEEV